MIVAYKLVAWTNSVDASIGKACGGLWMRDKSAEREIF